MQTKPRISSILETNNLSQSITGVKAFNLSELKLKEELQFELPSQLRLGHLVEKIISNLIQSSTNYEVLYENIQVIKDKKTLGEIDFIIKNQRNEQIIHLELAYKFYLYDPNISEHAFNNWVGPNRNDSLKEKLEKLKNKQFPLLHHNFTQSILPDVAINEVSQSLCFLVSLFIPYQCKRTYAPSYAKAIKGYYLNLDAFIKMDHALKSYYLPTKNEWGMDPADNEIWTDFEGIVKQAESIIQEKQATLCWQKHKQSYLTFFIVWW